MANKKMTKRDYFAELRAIPDVASNQALVDFIDHEVELLTKKNSAERKPTARQNENVGIGASILASMEQNHLYTISELMKFVEIPDFTNQRCSAIVRGLVSDGKIIRSEDKRKAYFTIA